MCVEYFSLLCFIVNNYYAERKRSAVKCTYDLFPIAMQMNVVHKKSRQISLWSGGVFHIQVLLPWASFWDLCSAKMLLDLVIHSASENNIYISIYFEVKRYFFFNFLICSRGFKNVCRHFSCMNMNRILNLLIQNIHWNKFAMFLYLPV